MNMKNTRLYLQHSLALLTLSTLIWVGTPANSQAVPQDNTQAMPRDNDTTRGEMARFDQFTDSHPEIAEQLHQNPSLVNNEDFVEKHPALQEFLQQHPGVREELKENPNAFMRQEQRFDRREEDRDRDRDRDATRGQMASFDRFTDSHPEIAEQLRKDPSLMKNEEFLEKHPALQQYLQQHPEVREQLTENPNAFMRQEQRFDRREEDRDRDRDRDRDTTRGEMASFDRFTDSHPEIAEQLRKDPSLVRNEEFVEKHPALQQYLQQHPGVREEIRENPNAFMRQEQRFDRFENSGDRDTTHGQLASFGQFLGSHSSIAQQLSKDPRLANNHEYMETHPELQQYLKAHPGVQEELKENPQAFMKSVQQLNNGNPTPNASNPEPKMKQKQQH